MRSALLVLTLLVNGCAHFPNTLWHQNHDELIAEHNYKKALEQIIIDQPNNTRLHKTIKRKANAFRVTQLKMVDSLIEQQKWGEASLAIKQLIETQPWHDSFSKIQDKLQNEKKEELRVLETQKALAEANLLKANLLMDNFKHREEPVFSGFYTRKTTLQEQKLELAKKLFELSIQALAAQDYMSAQKTYAQALSLDNKLKATLLSNAINMGVHNSNRTAIQAKQDRLETQLKTAIREGDFESLIQLQSILSKPPFEGENLNKTLTLAGKKRTTAAQILDSRADNIYRDGDIESAISLWRRAKYLAPDLLGVQDKLVRALKVQKKLAKLRQNQS